MEMGTQDEIPQSRLCEPRNNAGAPLEACSARLSTEGLDDQNRFLFSAINGVPRKPGRYHKLEEQNTMCKDKNPDRSCMSAPAEESQIQGRCGALPLVNSTRQSLLSSFPQEIKIPYHDSRTSCVEGVERFPHGTTSRRKSSVCPAVQARESRHRFGNPRPCEVPFRIVFWIVTARHG